MKAEKRAIIQQSPHWDDFKQHLADYKAEISNIEYIQNTEDFERAKKDIELINDFISEIDQKDAFTRVNKTDPTNIDNYS